MASHDLCNAKTTILGATPGAIPGIDGNPHERFQLPMHSRSVFSRIGVVPARQIYLLKSVLEIAVISGLRCWNLTIAITKLARNRRTQDKKSYLNSAREVRRTNCPPHLGPDAGRFQCNSSGKDEMQ